MACFLVPWRLKFEINIPYDALLTGYFIFENNLANARANSTIVIVALALWASIDCIIYSLLFYPKQNDSSPDNLSFGLSAADDTCSALSMANWYYTLNRADKPQMSRDMTKPTK